MEQTFNIYIVGLGGQGVLTVGELIAFAIQKKGLPVNFFPTKGMSQRGGFVQVQIRIGSGFGPALSPKSADLVIAMERSEGLKGMKFAKADADFLFFDESWITPAVITKKAHYPTTDEVVNEVKACCKNFIYMNESQLKRADGSESRTNMYIFGALISKTNLKNFLNIDDAKQIVSETWPKGAQENIQSLLHGYEN